MNDNNYPTYKKVIKISIIYNLCWECKLFKFVYLHIYLLCLYVYVIINCDKNVIVIKYVWFRISASGSWVFVTLLL